MKSLFMFVLAISFAHADMSGLVMGQQESLGRIGENQSIHKFYCPATDFTSSRSNELKGQELIKRIKSTDKVIVGG